MKTCDVIGPVHCPEGRRPRTARTPLGLLVVLLAVLAQASVVQAATINAASCNANAVQAAFNQANAGDTVQIPAGTCSWTSKVHWDAPPNVTIRGAGNLNVQGGGNATILVDNYSSTGSILSITVSDAGTFRFAGITIRGGSGAVKEGGILSFDGNNRNVRIDHITVDKSTYSPQNSGKFMVIGGQLRGVIDSSIFNAGTAIAWIHFVNGQHTGGHGDLTWAQPAGWGTSDFMYVEDSELIAGRSGSTPPMGTWSDCHTGGKFVLRYSTALNGNFAQTHPTGHAGDDRGCRAFEVYGNTATNNHGSSEQNFAFSYNNSGSQIVWGNDVGNGTYKNIIYFNICRTDSSCGYTPPYGGWGVCGQNSPWDQNSAANGYACLDQPGRGQGDLLAGTFPNRIIQALGLPAWPRQQLEPMYEWLTTGTNGTGWGGSWLNNGASPQVEQNRDFFFHHGNSGCNPGAATCATGVGVGTLSQRPSQCALNTAWWATDAGGNWHRTNSTTNDGALYRCISPNTWTLHYTPYQYPHPLRADSTVAIPNAPSQLSIVN